MLNMFFYFLIFALGMISGSIITVFTAVVRVERKDKSSAEDNRYKEKFQAEDDNPFEEDKEARKYREKFINFFS